MSLPTNYRQVAMMGPTPTPGPTHVYMPASPMMSNILKERLARSGGGSAGKGVGEANVPSPFSTPVHGNPAFNPQKMGSNKSTGAEGRIPKPPKAPDKPLMPYMRYSRKVWDQVKAANNDLKLWEIGKIIGSMWRDLPEADKQDFVDEYESEKADYVKALEEYHNSPAYKQYLAAKAKGTAATEEKEIVERTTSALAPGTKLDRRIDIQPAEDDDSQYHDDGVSVKQVSHARYARNHRLANEIFSDTLVPDVRSVVTTQRLTVLRRQVQSLTMHQKKLETELQQIEEKFEAKKRKFVEAGDSFQAELKKVKAMAPKLDHTSFLAMVERMREVLRREAEERQRTAQGLPPRPPSTSSPQAATATTPREEGGEATGPAPQNTATLVDAPSPAQPQDSSESGGDTESKGEASASVTPAVPATTAAPATPADANPTTTAPATSTDDTTSTTTATTIATTPALNGPSTPTTAPTSGSSSPALTPQPAPVPATQDPTPNPNPTQGSANAPSQAAQFPNMSAGPVSGLGQPSGPSPSGGSVTTAATGDTATPEPAPVSTAAPSTPAQASDPTITTPATGITPTQAGASTPHTAAPPQSSTPPS